MDAYLGWIFLALGGISRIFIPWLNARRLNPEQAQWAWRYFWPQLVTLAIAALLLPMTVPDIATIGGLEMAPAYLVGWGAADVGRFVDKLVSKN